MLLRECGQNIPGGYAADLEAEPPKNIISGNGEASLTALRFGIAVE